MLSMNAREHRVDIKWRRRWWDAGRVDKERWIGRGRKERRKRERVSGASGDEGKMLMVKSFDEVRLIRTAWIAYLITQAR
jgi:hypothetical protein